MLAFYDRVLQERHRRYLVLAGFKGQWLVWNIVAGFESTPLVPDILSHYSQMQFSRPMAVGVPMCGKCNELDSKIEHYRKLASRLSDRLALDGIAARIEEMEAQKVQFHPEQKR